MKVAICGAGIAGLALAERLSALGAEVVLLERSSGPRAQGYMIDFFGAGYDAAEAIGVLPAIEKVSHRITEASLVDESGRRRAGLRYTQIAKALDGRICSLMRPDLEKVLRDNLPGDVDLRFGTSVADVSHREDGVTVTLDGGAQLDVDLLVGADGIHSTVRALVFGAESQYLRYLGFHSAAYVFAAAGIRDAAADRFVLTDTIDRQMGFYALRDGRVAVFAVHRTPDPELPQDARAAIQDRYAGMGWLVPEALERCPPSADIFYDQVAQVEMPHWRKGRVVLIGDACGAVSLIAGQGASLAVGGAYVLAEQLRRTSSLERALDFYERLWRPVVEEKQEAGRDAAKLFLPASSSQQWTRRTALRLAGLPMVRRRINARLIGEPTAVIAMLRSGSPEFDSSGS
ncbi:FAD-dependent monooxygenase [Mycobacterium angelicum]|uniref:FAD-dependent oxidoreductase n=1 Tax=Mycobacterium angelicum TaxID=470074 RepID=A0A1W9ZLS4_MYCAN|nr:FAD-dependent monooxygenase [Mycobacterium angelicum]MCV7195744.1 FAD-dependent monooxygenase [Mycobacterium angelicum]ORA18449.1 FAD-dependent oxidoreductase [Mycobacterium angelicum]